MIEVGNPNPVYSKFCRGSSVHWSEDNRLAINVEGGVIILPASRPSGGGTAVCEFPDRRDIDIRAAPDLGSSELTSQLVAPKLAAREGERLGQGVESTSHCWSPLGLSSCGGCLLTVVTRDHKVTVVLCPLRLAFGNKPKIINQKNQLSVVCNDTNLQVLLCMGCRSSFMIRMHAKSPANGSLLVIYRRTY
jgi:hypothetical protein